MDASADVIVVGAGPSGLMAATCLARWGARVIVVDGKDGPTRESRALGLQARSLELYDQLGLSERVLAEATCAAALHPGSGRRVFGTVPLTEMGRTVTPFPGVFVLEQSRNEQILYDAFTALGGTVRWRHELVALEDRPDGGVSATVAGPDGAEQLDGRWLIAADGASSTVRKERGIRFEGTTSPLSYFVTDALDATGLVEDGINLRVAGDDILLAFPMGGAGHHRILGIAEHADETDDARVEAGVRAMLSERFGVSYTSSSWFARYRTHHRLAERFRDGAVFLVGDAAHVHSPVGAQGMNTGLQDAHNLACKLGQVLAEDAPESMLDEYEHERRPVADRLVQTTDALFTRITSRGRLPRFVRTRIVPAAGPLIVALAPRAARGERLYGYLSQTRIRYRMPGGHGRDPVVGRRLPWTGDNHASLREFTWQLHGYGVPTDAVARAARALGVDPHAHPRDPFHRLAPDRLYLVRPDGFVAGAAAPRVAVATLHDLLPRLAHPPL